MSIDRCAYMDPEFVDMCTNSNADCYLEDCAAWMNPWECPHYLEEEGILDD